MNPVRTKVIPFSIHREKKTQTQAMGKAVSLFRVFGFISKATASSPSTTAIHIQGMRFECPCRPVKRYVKWFMCSGIWL